MDQVFHQTDMYKSTYAWTSECYPNWKYAEIALDLNKKLLWKGKKDTRLRFLTPQKDSNPTCRILSYATKEKENTNS
jgi:hypothetical protein